MSKSKKLFIISGALLAVMLLAAACSNPGDGIKDITWQWSSYSETGPAAQTDVSNPENYTLTLMPDGTMSIKADCNMVLGSYTLEGDSLTLSQGPSTLAYCGEQSLDMLYLEKLNLVESYTLENDQLVLALQNNAGEMTFTK